MSDSTPVRRPALRGAASAARPRLVLVPPERPFPARPADPRSRPPLRLTRRGRVLAVALLVAVLGLAFLLGRVTSCAHPARPAAPPAVSRHASTPPVPRHAGVLAFPAPAAYCPTQHLVITLM